MEGIVSALANALGALRRAPGNQGWLEPVLSKFERSRAEDYQRVRRTIGFARDLAALAKLPDDERAALSLGLLFHGLIGEATPGRITLQPPRAWTDYLWGEDWVLPCLEIVHFLRRPDWGGEDSEDSMGAVLAKAVWTIDTETIIHGTGTVRVLRALREQSGGVNLERLSQLLWSEAGQSLCDAYTRHRGGAYTLKADDLKEAVRVLKTGLAPRASPRPAAQPEPAEPPVRPTAASSRTAPPSPRATPPSPRAAALKRQAAMPTSDNFERRKRALSSGVNDLWGADAPPPERQAPPARAAAQEPAPAPDDATLAESEELAARVMRHREAPPEPPPERPRLERERPPIEEEPDTRTSPGTRRVEVAMDATRTLAAREQHDGANLVDRLEELRLRFDQIERIAAEGRELLAALSPQLGELSAMLVQVEALLGARDQRVA
jgi:hypothetical protein